MTLNKPKRHHYIIFPLFRTFFIFILLSTATALIYFFPPDYQITLYQLTIPILYPFFLVVFLTIYFLINNLFRSKKHGLLLASFTIVYLLFRLNNLTHPIFLALLIGLFLIAEILFTRPKNQ